jgi:hypothetical protein
MKTAGRKVSTVAAADVPGVPTDGGPTIGGISVTATPKRLAGYKPLSAHANDSRRCWVVGSPAVAMSEPRCGRQAGFRGAGAI